MPDFNYIRIFSKNYDKVLKKKKFTEIATVGAVLMRADRGTVMAKTLQAIFVPMLMHLQRSKMITELLRIIFWNTMHFNVDMFQ